MAFSQSLGAPRHLLLAFVTALLLAGSYASVNSAAATPAASKRDAASTRAFIRGEVQIHGAFATHMAAITASANAVAEQVNANCPKVLAKATGCTWRCTDARTGRADSPGVSPAARSVGRTLWVACPIDATATPGRRRHPPGPE